MNIHAITPHVDYIGCNDRTTFKFENLWPLPYGVSYNSYLVRGKEKSAVIDGVEVSNALTQIARIQDLLGGKHPDYLVINHMEPDHSGSIRILKQAWPDIKVVGNPITLGMVKGYYGDPGDCLTVKDGDRLPLGEATLKFVTTPMVHWPETMMTLLEEEQLLFAGDAFGCFGALNGAVTDSHMDTGLYFSEMVRYYSNIVGKYGTFVQKALKKLNGTVLKTICSTHGPVWQQKIPEVMSVYDRLSRYEALDNGVTVIYGSMYGNTQKLVEALCEGLAEGSVRNISVHNASKSHLSHMIADAFTHRGLVVASPTYSETVFPPVQAFLDAIKTRGLTGRVTGAIGSFTWVSKSGGAIESALTDLAMPPVSPALLMKQGPNPDLLESARSLGRSLAAAL